MRTRIALVLSALLSAALCVVINPSAAAVPASATGHLTSVTPVRVLDTRKAIGIGTRTPIGGRRTVTFSVGSAVP